MKRPTTEQKFKYTRQLIRIATAAEQQLEKTKDPDAAQKLHAEIQGLQEAMHQACGSWTSQGSRIAQMIEAFQVIFASIFPTKIVQVEGPVLLPGAPRQRDAPGSFFSTEV